MFWLICHGIYFYVWAPSQHTASLDDSLNTHKTKSTKIKKSRLLPWNLTPRLLWKNVRILIPSSAFFFIIIVYSFQLAMCGLAYRRGGRVKLRGLEEQVWPLLVVLTTAWGPGDTSPVSALTRPLDGTACA